MVWSDVEQDCHVGTEFVHVVKLETAQLDDVVLVRSFCHLQRQTLADIASQSYIVSSRLDDVIDQRSSCGLAIATCDADHLGICISAGKFYFADDRSTLCHQFLNHRSFLRNARALDDFISV